MRIGARGGQLTETVANWIAVQVSSVLGGAQ
jgi:hypothetical protein